MQMEEKTGLIFQTTNGTPVDPANIYRRWFTPAVKRANKKTLEIKDEASRESAQRTLDGLRLHDLRHTFGSWKIEQGEDVLYVSSQLGHSKPSITFDVYSHLLKEHRPHAAAKTDELLFGTSKKS
jgi:integrase